MLESYLNSIGYVLALILAGIVVKSLRPLKAISEPAARSLNAAALWIILPAVIFISIGRHPIREISRFASAAVLAIIPLSLCFILAAALSIAMRSDKGTITAVALNSAFMNVSYLGLPVVFALIGPKGLGPASLYAVAVGILHLILGVTLASSVGGGRVSLRFALESVFTFPATLALIAALIVVGFRAHVPSPVVDAFDLYLAGPFFALMPFLIGYQMPVVNPLKYVRELAAVGAMRFLVSPLATYALIGLLGLDLALGASPKPSLIMAVMPPAMFNVILAHNFNLDLRLHGAMILYPTFISLFVALPALALLIPL